MQLRYQEIAYGGHEPRVTKPTEELDALLIADRTFFSMARSSLSPTPSGDPRNIATWLPHSSLMMHATDGVPGLPLMQFLSWLARSIGEASPLDSLSAMLGPGQATGHMKFWPLDIYPAHIPRTREMLLTQLGFPIVV